MTFLPPSEANIVDAIPYHRASRRLRREFALLQDRVYGPDLPKSPRPLHDPAFDVLSFYIGGTRRVVSYAAVAMKAIRHAGRAFEIAGLSCVMTDLAYERRGLGLRTVAAATRCMERSNIDMGLFTCDPPLVPFYAKAGAWQVASDIVLVGSEDEGALRSDSLGKAVLIRLFSDEARKAAAVLRGTTIDLGLPVGQFL